MLHLSCYFTTSNFNIIVETLEYKRNKYESFIIYQIASNIPDEIKRVKKQTYFWFLNSFMTGACII